MTKVSDPGLVERLRKESDHVHGVNRNTVASAIMNEAADRIERLEAALRGLIFLHDGFMIVNDGLMGNQADAYYCVAKHFGTWDKARAALHDDAQPQGGQSSDRS